MDICMDMDISVDIHGKSVDMDMDMDMNGKFHIHGKPAYTPPKMGAPPTFFFSKRGQKLAYNFAY